MDDDEPILLHEPDLMLALLRSASEGPAGIETALARLVQTRAVAGEPPPAVPDELRQRLRDAAELLVGAEALTLAGDDRFQLTGRGARLLADYPDGVDQSVLHAFPEFRAYVAARLRQAPPDDPRLQVYDAGMQAHGLGLGNDANPHALDSADHLAWECGWSEARDRAQQS